MSNPPPVDANLAELETELRAGLESEFHHRGEAYDFDMDDQRDDAVLRKFPALHSALQILARQLPEKWRAADCDARISQSRHRALARVSILTGAAAIILTTLQLIFTQLHQIGSNESGWQGKFGLLEYIAIVTGAVAVVVGLTVKFNRRWLGKRHQAEQLRMLKFQALIRPELACDRHDDWKKWIANQLAGLEDANDFHHVEQWASQEQVHDALPAPPGCAPEGNFLPALAIYYRVKRLEFQARYFHERARKFRQQFRGWGRIGTPLFFITLLCALGHYGAEHHAYKLVAGHQETAAQSWEIAALWFVAAGVGIPVIGLSIRAWFAAFEIPRSASLYLAKEKALEVAARQLAVEDTTETAILNDLARDEHFLENEHREWLRLLMDAEWFL
jgi:cell division protein FtsL